MAQNALFLMISRQSSQVLAQCLLRISVFTTLKPLDFIKDSYSSIVCNWTSMPFSIGLRDFLCSRAVRPSFLNQSVIAIVPPDFKRFAAEAKNFSGFG